MCLLFCSGAGMCGTGCHCHTGQLTAGTQRGGVKVIGSVHKEKGSLQPPALMWPDFTVTMSSMSFSSSSADDNNHCYLLQKIQRGEEASHICLVTPDIQHNGKPSTESPVTHENWMWSTAKFIPVGWLSSWAAIDVIFPDKVIQILHFTLPGVSFSNPEKRHSEVNHLTINWLSLYRSVFC